MVSRSRTVATRPGASMSCFLCVGRKGGAGSTPAIRPATPKAASEKSLAAFSFPGA